MMQIPKTKEGKNIECFAKNECKILEHSRDREQDLLFS
jgi:hypothetical protein